MKKFWATIVTLCVLFSCMAANVAVAEQEEYIESEELFIGENFELEEGEQGELLGTFEVDQKGQIIVHTRNTDWAQLNEVYNLAGFTLPSGTHNIKIHMYMTSTSGDVYVYFHEGPGNATWSDPIRAIWSGSGHKYADLKLNAGGGHYSVFVYGAFSGSGAVYTEP